MADNVSSVQTLLSLSSLRPAGIRHTAEPNTISLSLGPTIELTIQGVSATTGGTLNGEDASFLRAKRSRDAVVKSGCRMETVACEPQPQRGDYCVGEEAWLGLLGLFSLQICSFLHKILNRNGITFACKK